MKEPLPLSVYNTLSRTKERFKPPKKGPVGMYSCGPTVYAAPHIGNMRAYVFSDLLKRVLLYKGLKVKHVMNVTDVGHLVGDADSAEDKMELAVQKEHKPAQAIALHYLAMFQEDMKKLHILSADVMPKATDHVKEQIALIKILEKKGYTYRTSDGIYFDSTKFKNYGTLARLNVKGMQAGKRVQVGEKKHPTDFALWKFSLRPGERQQEWKSPWGVGYPGWHIECSAMSMKYLGKQFDIHTGGEDHIPVHHTNEIAQSEAATGKPFVRYWLHGAFLTFGGKKVSKSTGGLYTITDIEALGYKPEHYRYLLLMTHYRKQLDFSLDALDAARNAYERLIMRYREFRDAPKIMVSKETATAYMKQFVAAIDDDLNLPAALGIVWDVINDGGLSHYQKALLLNDFDKILGFDLKAIKEESIPREVQKLMKEREVARKVKNWKLADELRATSRALLYEIEDTPSGPKAKKIDKK